MATTTTTTITDTQILDMLAGADAAGDRAMAAICCLALDGWVSSARMATLRDEEYEIVAHVILLSRRHQLTTQDAARAECARVLAEQAAL